MAAKAVKRKRSDGLSDLVIVRTSRPLISSSAWNPLLQLGRIVVNCEYQSAIEDVSYCMHHSFRLGSLSRRLSS